MFRGRRPLWAGGFGLIALGVVGLYLSYAATQGWWQSTCQALGVGFLVGGLVDVLTISLLTQLIQKNEENAAQIKERISFEAEVRKEEKRLGAMLREAQEALLAGQQVELKLVPRDPKIT